MADIKNIFKGILPKDQKQWKVFLACLTVSTILWGLLKFSEEREDEVQVSLKFVNFPKNEMIISDLPTSMPVKLRAQGFDLISRSIGFNEPQVEIDLSKVMMLSKGDLKQYVWLPKLNAKEISKALGSGFKSSVYPVDTVKVLFSEITTKELNTYFDFDILNAKEHFVYKKPLISPSKIKVSGAKAILNNLDTIKTVKSKIDVLESDLDQDFALIRPFGVDSLYQDSVRVYLGVEVLKEHQFEIPLIVKNAPDSLEFKLFPNEVVVSFTCGSSDLIQISPNEFSVEVDYKDVQSSFERLTVDLVKAPKLVKDIRVEPASVEYLIKSKD